MTYLYELTDYLESIAPLQLQESYDNAGLIVGDKNLKITGVTVCLDSTEAVIDEAIHAGNNVVIAHHPIIFAGLRQLTGKNYIERTVIKAIKNNIAIYAIHTNLDNILTQGVNERIAERLGLRDQKILLPKTSESTRIGAGLVGYLSNQMELEEFLLHIKKQMNASCVKYTDKTKDTVLKIGLCGGSGSFLLEQAIQEECDVFISSDFKYHQFFDANNQLVIVDIGHFETEQFTIDLLVEIINKKFSNFAAHYTKVYTNPVNYI
jgi:dinuclear metal center YbgI/SA1388 family protein